MGTIMELAPPAKALINGIRAIGYSFSTAVADIIDNSISAKATNIDIYSDPLDDQPYFSILVFSLEDITSDLFFTKPYLLHNLLT